nr:molybdate ABC transporter substrate-binding protein [Sporosarcina sp. YIM B06819]
MITAGCSAGESEEQVEVMISAAASLTDALTDMKASFESEHDNITLTFNFGSSGKLVQQIEQGAPSDIFLSASKKDMDTLEEGKLLLEGTRVDFTANELVLITNKDELLTVDSFEDIDPSTIAHFAIGEPEGVPVGRYTKEVLENIGLWDPLQDKMVLGSDVRQVLTHVEMGNADLGVVYSSDAKISDKVKVLAVASAEWHGPIVYPGAVVSETKHPEEAKAFLAYLTSDKGKEILKKYGFK